LPDVVRWPERGDRADNAGASPIYGQGRSQVTTPSGHDISAPLQFMVQLFPAVQ
jgi:hypothetical protein